MRHPVIITSASSLTFKLEIMVDYWLIETYKTLIETQTNNFYVFNAIGIDDLPRHSVMQ